MSTFVVAGITQLETIVNVEHLPVEYVPMSSTPFSINIAPGGDAYNETVALTWLGDEVRLLSVVGRDTDMKLLSNPGHKVKIETDLMLPLADDMPMQVILCDKERNQQIFEDIKGLRDITYDMAMVPPHIAHSDMVVLSNANFCRPFIKAAQRFNKPIAVNIHEFRREKEQYNEDFLSAASVLYFSDDTLTEDPFDFVKSIADKYNTDIIILGQGAKGLVLYDRKRNINVHYNTVKTNEVVNTAGAGNALLACFLHFYLETGDSTAAIKDALLFASYKIGYVGTSNGFLTVEQLEQWRNLIWGIKAPGNIQ
ncbi:MAG: carbohydrate kinase family protein [Lachnospiraceae bacterium]|nr:carbohydrate kinase family protein [Lachnospiraceae bacterium]